MSYISVGTKARVALLCSHRPRGMTHVVLTHDLSTMVPALHLDGQPTFLAIARFTPYRPDHRGYSASRPVFEGLRPDKCRNLPAAPVDRLCWMGLQLQYSGELRHATCGRYFARRRSILSETIAVRG
jgi:hypothetical protein